MSDRPQLSAATGHISFELLAEDVDRPVVVAVQDLDLAGGEGEGRRLGVGALGRAAERREHAIEQARADHDRRRRAPRRAGHRRRRRTGGDGRDGGAPAATRSRRRSGPTGRAAAGAGRAGGRGARAAARRTRPRRRGTDRTTRDGRSASRRRPGAAGRRGAAPRGCGRARDRRRTAPAEAWDSRSPAPPAAGIGVALGGGALLGEGLGVELGLALGGERLAQALAGPGEQGAGGDVRDAQGGGELEAREVVELGEEQRGALALRDPLERPLELARQARLHHEVLGGRRGVAGLADERDEPDDAPAAEMVERDAVGDLVQPGTRVLGLLERVVGAIGLHERVLREVRGEVGVAEHAQEVGVDLVLVLGEQLLDEGVGVVAVPAGAHGEAHGQGSALVQLEGFGSHGCSPGIDRAGKPIGSVRLRPRVTVRSRRV